jgi:broad specificity phosphatase PhoE
MVDRHATSVLGSSDNAVTTPLDNPQLAWIGLMRHGETFKRWMTPDKRCESMPILTRNGVLELRAVGSRLAETLSEYGEGFPKHIRVLCAPTKEARASAYILAKELGLRAEELTPDKSDVGDLDPRQWSAYNSTDSRVTTAWASIGESRPLANKPTERR